MRIESTQQIIFARLMLDRYPDVWWTISTAGAQMPPRVMVLLKMMGYKKGTPDIFIFEPNDSYKALFIELKAPKTAYNEKGQSTKEQREFIAAMNKKGYFASFCYGADEAFALVEKYLKNQLPKQETSLCTQKSI